MYSTLQIYHVKDTCSVWGKTRVNKNHRSCPGKPSNLSLSCPISPLPLSGAQCSSSAQLSLALESSNQGKALYPNTYTGECAVHTESIGLLRQDLGNEVESKQAWIIFKQSEVRFSKQDGVIKGFLSSGMTRLAGGSNCCTATRKWGKGRYEEHNSVRKRKLDRESEPCSRMKFQDETREN